MVSYKWVSLALYNANACWELYLAYRQFRCLLAATEIPPALASEITPEQFEKANAYSIDRLKVGAARTVLDCAFTNIFISCDVLPTVWYGTTGRFLEGSLAHCLLFSVATDFVETITSLPISYYSVFHVEHKHGFNTQTQGVFFGDVLKGRALNLVVTVPVYAGVLEILRRFGPQFPLYLGGFLSATALAFSFIYPTLIQPLFNKFTPLPDGSLRTQIDALAKEISFPLTRVYVVDGSTRSNHSNAYFYGFFKNKRIVLYDTLLTQMKDHDRSLLAVLAHEFGHWKLRHTLFQLALGISQVFGICYGAQRIVYNAECYKSFGFHTTPRVIGLMLFVLVVMTPIEAFLSMAVTAAIRQMEFQADRFSCDMGYGEDMQKALLLMREHNSMSVVYDRLYAACKYTHPPLLQRMEAIRAHIKKKST